MLPNPRHPDRWRQVKLSRTAYRGSEQKTFQQSILDVCFHRKDDLANQVQMRLHGAISDLHAADARYHDDCRGTSMAARSIKAAATANDDNGSMAKDTAFETVVNVMNSDVSHIWTSIETHSLYLAHGGCLSRYSLVHKLSDYFGKDMIVLYATGLASLLIFRSKASKVLRIEDDNDDDLLVGKIAKQILNESKNLTPSKDSYNTRTDNDIAAEDASSTLLSLLSKIDILCLLF